MESNNKWTINLNPKISKLPDLTKKLVSWEFWLYNFVIFGIFLTAFAFFLERSGDRESKSAFAFLDWYYDFTPTTVFYVSPDGSGNGRTIETPMSLETALNQANPGEMYYLLEGTYINGQENSDDYGKIRLTRSGRQDFPIVWKAYPGHRATIEGNISMGTPGGGNNGSYNWIWGLEITDPNYLVKRRNVNTAAVTMYAEGSAVINNVIHNAVNKNGIGDWGIEANSSLENGTLQNHLIYGNIIYKNGIRQTDCNYRPAHNIHVHHSYRDNSKNIYGERYIIQNLIANPDSVCANSYNVHAKSNGAKVSGIHFEGNILLGGEYRMQGEDWPLEKMVINRNFFFDKGIYAAGRPFQGKVTNNHFYNAAISIDSLWGRDEHVLADNRVSTEITENEVFSDGYNITLTTGSYTAKPGQTAVLANTIVDRNIYSAFSDTGKPNIFRGALLANKKALSIWGLDVWQKETPQVRANYPRAGIGLDQNSTVTSIPTTNNYYFEQNIYEPNKGFLIILNWERGTIMPIDLSTYYDSGSKVNVYEYTNIYGDPLVTSAEVSDFSVPLNNNQYQVFYVVIDPVNQVTNIP